MISQTRVRLSTVVYLDALEKLADVMQHAPSGVSRPAHLAVGLRLLWATLKSTLREEALLINLDQERTRTQRGSLTDKEESLALRELYPALRQMEYDGDIAIRFLDRRDQHPEDKTWRAINDQWSVSDDPSQASAFIDLSALPPLVARPPRVQPPRIPTVDGSNPSPSPGPTTWRNHVDLSAEPSYVSRGNDAPPRRIRLFIALDDDIRIEQMGQLALRKYAGDLVWVRLSRDGRWSLRAGSGLLVDAAGDASFQLIVGGQGQIDEVTGSRLVSGYRPQALADAIGPLLESLRSGLPARVESTRLLADSLKPPANGGFGRDFALAADRSGWARPGMRTTTYADLLSLGRDDPDGYRIFAKVDPGTPPPARNAGQAWQFWVEDGEVRRQDKHMPAQDEVDRSLGLLPGNTDPTAQARRVDRALVVLDQLPGWDDDLSTSERQDLLQRVRQAVLDDLKTRPAPDPTSPAHAQLLSDVSRDVAAGLLGERGRLRLAFTRLRDASSIAGKQDLAARICVWPIRANALGRTVELAQALFARGDRTRALWATYFNRALTAGNWLLAQETGGLSSKLTRRVGWNNLVAATTSAAMQRDVVVVDVSSEVEASDADIEVVRARHLIRHLADTGVIGGALAVTSDVSIAVPGRWREVSIPMQPPDASTGPTSERLWLRALSDEAVLDAMPQVMAQVAGDHLVWRRPSESDVASQVQAAADAPLAEALQRLNALRSENADEIKMINFVRRDLAGRKQDILARAPTEPGTDYARLRRVAGDIAREVGVPIAGWREIRRRLELDEGELTPLVEEALGIHASAIEAATQGMAALQARFRDERVGASLDVHDALPADAPFAFFVDRGPDFSQSLDRRRGLITLRDRFLDLDTEVRVRPLDAFEGPGISAPEARARQDAEIRIAEALIVRLLDAPDGEFRLAPLGLESLPRRMALDDAGFHVNGTVVAVPRDDLSAEQRRTVATGWRVKDDSAASLLRSLSAAEQRGDWSIKHLPKLPDPPSDAVPTRLKIVLQLAGDSDSATAAWLLARKHKGRAVWLQDRSQTEGSQSFAISGKHFLDRLTGAAEADLLVVGHGGMSTTGEQTLSGWTPQRLASRVQELVQGLPAPGGKLSLRRVSLIACDLASPYVEAPFAHAFVKTLLKQPGMSEVSVTARTGRLHVIGADVLGDERIRIVTERKQPDGEIMLRHRMPGDTMVYTREGETVPFTVTDKYPADDVDVPERWSVFADLLPRSLDAVLSDPGAGPSSASAPKGPNFPQPESGFAGLALPRRLTAVAASLQTGVASWDLSAPPALQAQRDALTDATWQAFEKKKPLSGKSRAVAEHMVEGLLTGSASSFLKAYVGVLNAQGANVAGDPAKLQDVHAAYETLRTTAMEQLGTANADLRVHTNSAIAHLFGRAARATDGSPLLLDFVAIDEDAVLGVLAPPEVANAGVELELARTLSQLHDTGFIGPVQWRSSHRPVSGAWTASGKDFVSSMDAPALLWTDVHFDPINGLLWGQPARSFDPPPIADDLPLPGLAALERRIRQSLDPRTGMVRLSWEDLEGSIGVARMRVDDLPPAVDGGGRPRARALGDALRRLDLMVIALASNETGEIVPDRLPATLTLTDDALRSGDLVVANRSPQGWSFKRGDAWTPPPRLAGGEPTLSMTGTGRARAIASSLSLVPEAWFGDPGKLGPYRHELVEGYGDTAFAAPDASVQIDPEVRRVAAETLMMGILDPSLATMERARRLLLDAANQAGTVGDESPDTRAARALRHLVEGAEQHLMGGTDQRAMTESVQGRLLANFFSSTLVSGPTTPFHLDYDRLRRGIEGPNASPEDTSYAALILSMRDELDLLSSTGVIGEVEYTRKRRPVGGGAKWRHDDEGLWIASDDILDEQWPTAVFDPDQHRVQRLRFNDLREGWGKLADELSVDVRSRELKEWLNETSRKLKALLSRPRAAMAEGMSSEAWQRRVDEVSKLTQTPPDDPEVKALWDKVVARIGESAKLASSPAYQAAFGEGGRDLLPADSPLPFLGLARPDLKQRFDATSGALTIEKEGQTLTWQVQTAASTPETDRSWRQAQSLRELDVLLVASLDGTDSQSLPNKLLYESGELSADGVVIARIVPVAGWETAPAWDISDSEPESDVPLGSATPARTEAKPAGVPAGSVQSEIAPPSEAAAASDEMPMDVNQPTTSTAEEGTSRGTKRPLAEPDNVVPAKRDRPEGSSAVDVDAPRSEFESEFESETEYQPDSDSDYQPDSDSESGSESDSDAPPRTATKTRNETKTVPISEGSTRSEIAPPTEVTAASDEKPMDVHQPTTSTAEESTSRGAERPLAEQDNVVPARRDRPDGSSAADVDSSGIVSVETTGDTSLTIPNSKAIDTLIVAWLDRQWSGTETKVKWKTNDRSALIKAISSEAQTRGQIDSGAVDELCSLVNKGNASSSAAFLLDIHERFAGNPTVGTGASMSRREAASLLSAAIRRTRKSGESQVAWDSLSDWIFAALDSSQQRKGLRIDADALLQLQQRGSEGELVASKIVKLQPVLEALSARGVIGQIKVVAKEETTLKRGTWVAHGKDGYHVARTPLSGILQQQGDVSTPALVYDKNDALPGLSLVWYRKYSTSTRQIVAKLGHDDSGAAKHFQFKTTRSGSVESKSSTIHYLRIGDSMDASAAAMDLDVAAAHLIANGSVAARMPKRLIANPREVSLARKIGSAPLETTVALFERDGERLKPDAKAIEQFRAFMDAGEVQADVSRPDLNSWRNELLPRHQGNDAWSALLSRVRSSPADGVRSADRRTIVLQMDDSPSAYEASLRVMAREMSKDRRALWIQTDHSGNFQTYAGNTASFGPNNIPIKLVIVGQGANKGQSTTLSGYEGEDLGKRVTTLLGKNFPQQALPIDRITLLACKIASEFSASRFEDDFATGFKISPSKKARELAITAYRDIVLFPGDEPSKPDFSRRWTVGEGETQAIHHARNRTSITIKKLRSRQDQSMRKLTQKYQKEPTTKPLSEDATKLALDTALDMTLDVSGSDADRLNASIEKDLLFYRPDLGDELPSLTLRSLFADDQGVVDKERLDRIAEDATEQQQLAWDIEREFKTTTADAPLRDLIDESLAGCMVKLEGREVPARFLDALGARLDGQPLTAERLRVAGGHGVELGDRLQLDSARFEAVLPLLPSDADSTARVRTLSQWLRARHTQVDASLPLFFDTPSASALALTRRMVAAAGPDSSEADLLKAVHDRESGPKGLLDEIVDGLPDASRVEFRQWMDRIGLREDAPKTMNPPPPSPAQGSPVERVIAEMGRDAEHGHDIDFDTIDAINEKTSLAALEKIGAVRIDSQGVRLDNDRLTSLLSGEASPELAMADRAFRKLPGTLFQSLRRSASAPVVARMDASRSRPGPVTKMLGKVDGSVDFMDTALGIGQLIARGHEMDPVSLVLTSVQSSSMAVTPLLALLGRKLCALDAVTRMKVLRGLGTGLAGGVGNVVMAAVGVTACVFQGIDFVKSGQSIDSPAGKSFVLNTVMTSFSVGMALTGAVIGVKTILAGGTAALAGTAMGVASAILAKVAAPAAVVMFVINGMAQALLWFDEFGKYILDSASAGDRFAAGLAKVFGISTDLVLRAEMEKAAYEAATEYARTLKAQFKDSAQFEMDMLAKKQGYNEFFVPDTEHPVRHPVFHDHTTKKKYTFVLQAAEPIARDFVHHQRDRGGAAAPSVAVLSMDRINAWQGPIDDFGRDLIKGEKHAKRQLFQLGRSTSTVVEGSLHDDIFQMTAPDNVRLRGLGGDADEIQLDADGSDVNILHEFAGMKPVLRIEMPQRVTSWATDVHRISVHNARDVLIRGSDADERFDVSSAHALIDGGDGHNTYLLRDNNQIISTSNDMAIWSRGVRYARIDIGRRRDTRLLLKIDVLHEAVRYRRDGQRLVLSIGDDTLKLDGFFDRLEAPARDAMSDPPANPLMLIDALGRAVVLINPLSIGDQPVPPSQLEKHVTLPASGLAAPITLTGDEALTRYHLSSGSGDIRVEPMTAVPIDMALDIPIDRLRQEVQAEDLLIIETPPSDASQDFTPLRLRLVGQRDASGPWSAAPAMLWANGTDNKPLPLTLPDSDEQVAAAVRTVASSGFSSHGSGNDGAGQSTSTHSGTLPFLDPSPTQVRSGTVADDTLSWKGLPDGSILRGGEGSDTYWLYASPPAASGQHVVIDNFAQDRTQDVLQLRHIDTAEFLEQVRLSRIGDDLVIALARDTITVRNHATDPDARHLSVRVGTERFALPVIRSDGIFVHQPDEQGDALATAPGTHVFLSEPGAPWGDQPSTRRIRMRRPVEWVSHGDTVEAHGDGTTPSIVLIQDYHRRPGRWSLQVEGEGGFWNALPDGERPPSKALPQGAADIQHQLSFARHGWIDFDVAYAAADVQAHLRSKGMPGDIASRIRSATPRQLLRLHDLLRQVVDRHAWALPASVIDGFAASDVDLTPAQIPVLKDLAQRQMPWPTIELALREKLTLQDLQAHETFCARNLPRGIDDPDAGWALEELIRIRAGALPSRSVAVPLLPAVLQLKGRPAAVAESLARAMLDAGVPDADWVADMRLAGVEDYTVLQRLRESGISAHDVVLGNANRKAYEQGDRSALISVKASPTFKSAPQTEYRYLARRYLKFNDDRTGFHLAHSQAQQGVQYDLVPGQVLDTEGGSPENPQTLIDERNANLRKQAAKVEQDRSKSPWDSAQLYSPASFDDYPLPSVVILYEEGLLDYQPFTIEGSWEGRSLPQHLVDGHGESGEITAWRPAKTDVGPDKFIRFDFRHAIVLTGLALKLGPTSFASDKAREIKRGGPLGARWKVQGIRKDGQRIDVSAPFETACDSAKVKIDTQGVPYAAYEIVGIDGDFPATWFEEVEFQTGEAGASPVLQALTAESLFSHEDARWLARRGVQTPDGVKHARSLRAALGVELSLEATADDVARHAAPAERELGLFTRLNQTGRTPDQSLEIVRRGLSPRERIEVGLPLLRYRSWGTSLLTNSVVDPLRQAVVARLDGMTAPAARRDPDFTQTVAGLLLDAAAGDNDAIPAALVKLHDAQALLYGQHAVEVPRDWHSKTLRELTGSATTDRPALRVSAPEAIVGTTLGWIADVLRAQVMASHGRVNADMATLPVHLALATIAAMVEGRPAVLQAPVGTSPRAQELINKAAFELKRDLEPLGLMAPPTAMQSIRTEPSAEEDATERQRLQAVIDSLPARLHDAEAVEPLDAPLLAPLRCEVIRLLRKGARRIKLDDETVEAVSTLLLKASGGDWHAFGAAVDRLASASDMQGGELDITAIDWGAKAVKALTSTALDEEATRMGLMSVSVSLPAVVLAKLLEMRRGIISDALGDRVAQRSVAPGELMLATLGAAVARQPLVLRFPDGDTVADAARRQALTEAAAGLDALEAAGLLTLKVLRQGQPPEGQPGWTSIREGDDPISQALDPRTLLATATPRTPSAAAVPPSLEPLQSTARSPADLAALLTQAIAGFKHRCGDGIAASPAQPATSTWLDRLLAPSVG